MDDLVDVFNVWLDEYRTNPRWWRGIEPRSRWESKHKDKCDFVRATTEPNIGVYYGGYCETCSYESSCITFYGDCTCGGNREWTIEGEFELGALMRDFIRIHAEWDGKYAK